MVQPQQVPLEDMVQNTGSNVLYPSNELSEVQLDLESRPDYKEKSQIGREANAIVHDMKNTITALLMPCDGLIEEVSENDPAYGSLSSLRKSIGALSSIVISVNACSKNAEVPNSFFAELGYGMEQVYERINNETATAKSHFDRLKAEMGTQVDAYGMFLDYLDEGLIKIKEQAESLATVSDSASADYAEVNVSQFISDFVDGISAELDGNEIELRIIDKGPGKVYMDKEKMTRVLRTLYHNSRDALNGMNNGSKEIWVTAVHEFFDGQHMLSLGVHDNGPGFNVVADKKKHGTGIGLPYAGQVAKEHRGLMKMFDAYDAGKYQLDRMHGASVVVSIPIQQPTLH
jgi:signal transduction histidine kinase|tara:strand:+ start:6600 stop:7634 length:1035 start_codon:yes stop_codon:yes gene_type:complete